MFITERRDYFSGVCIYTDSSAWYSSSLDRLHRPDADFIVLIVKQPSLSATNCSSRPKLHGWGKRVFIHEHYLVISE
jgi:hypothetical protein